MKDVFEQMIVVTHSKDMVAYIQANDTDCNIITLQEKQDVHTIIFLCV